MNQEAEEKVVKRVGWIATAFCVSMYFSYIHQISLNLSGNKGSVLLPLATVFNSIAWVIYGFIKRQKDWPIIVSNLPGVVLGLATIITALA